MQELMNCWNDEKCINAAAAICHNFSASVVAMENSLRYLTIVFACVGGYRVLNDQGDPKKLKVTNEKIVYHPQNITVDTIHPDKEHHQHADYSSLNAYHSNALKKIHPFIYPKQFNTLDATTTTAFNVTPNTQRNASYSPVKVIRQQVDDSYGSSAIDHNGGYGDIIPIKADIHDLPMKHGSSSLYGYDDSYPAYTPSYSNIQNHLSLGQLNPLNPLNGVKNCLNGILPPVDSLLVLGILGFLIYVISSIMNLVNRVNIQSLISAPITNDPAAGTMTAANAVMAAATKLAKPITQRQLVDDRHIDTNQNLLRHFERILQMAIEMHEPARTKIQGVPLWCRIGFVLSI